MVYGKLLKGLRPTEGKLGELFGCPMCMGFHVGWFLMLLSPFTELFNFDITVVNFFLLGWLSSGTSYVLNMIFGDEGIKFEDGNSPHNTCTLIAPYYIGTSYTLSLPGDDGSANEVLQTNGSGVLDFKRL